MQLAHNDLRPENIYIDFESGDYKKLSAKISLSF